MSVDEDQPDVLFRAKLQRENLSSWGFRLQGGLEYDTPLTLLKVFVVISHLLFVILFTFMFHSSPRSHVSLCQGEYLS